MHIVHITSEFAPIAKVGGLADALGGLSKALAQLGEKITVVLPRYDCIDYGCVEELRPIEEQIDVREGNVTIHNSLWSAQCDGTELIFIEPHHPKAYFERGRIYGEFDDNDRFLYFCKVATSYIKKIKPDVVHLHDWPAAGCSLLLKRKIKTVFTIHNLQHQGVCADFNLQRLDISSDDLDIQDTQHDRAINLLRGALYYSDVITTVSPTYQKEILTAENGCGLEGDLLKNQKKLKGILNGIDTQYWDPSNDPFLRKQYSLPTYQSGKEINKRHLQRHFGLSEDDCPLVISVTRLVAQKAPDLIEYGMEKTVELGGQFALLGTSNDPEVLETFMRYQDHPNIAVHLKYDETLSHLFYSAGDFFFMPSIFEPCGLSQMISLRYGTVPIVHATGGLKDTIFDGKNGFTFSVPDNKGVAEALERAFAKYRQEEWNQLIENGMSSDLGWEQSAKKYRKLYE